MNHTQQHKICTTVRQYVNSIVINSHKNNKTALNRLLESMKYQNLFKQYKVIVCIGGYYENSEYKFETNENITYVECNHNSIDFTGLITICEAFSDLNINFLYLHDTTEVGPRFFDILSKIQIQSESIRLISSRPSMNMGIYSSNCIQNNKDFLMKTKNTTEHLTMKFKSEGVYLEDAIFRNDPTNLALQGTYKESGPSDVYNSGVMRISEYYSCLDLYKYKANWCIKEIYELNL